MTRPAHHFKRVAGNTDRWEQREVWNVHCSFSALNLFPNLKPLNPEPWSCAGAVTCPAVGSKGFTGTLVSQYEPENYLEGQGDSVSRFIEWIAGVTAWLIVVASIPC